MKRLLATLAGVALIAAGALGQTSGGYPSRPTFQSLTVSGAVNAGAIAGTIGTFTGAVNAGAASKTTLNQATFSATGNSAYTLNNTAAMGQTPLDFQINGTLAGRIRNDYAGNFAYVTTLSGSHTFLLGGDSGVGTQRMSVAPAGVSIFGVAGASFTNFAESITSPATTDQSNGLFVKAGTSANDAALNIQNAAATINILVVRGDGSMTTLANATQGPGTLNATALYQGGARVPRITSGVLNWVSGSTCAIAAGINITGCVYNSTGNYSVSFISAFSNVYSCTVSGVGPSTTPAATYISWTNSSAQLIGTNLTGTAINETMSFTCTGT